MPPLVRKASAFALQEISDSAAKHRQSERFAMTGRRTGPGSSGHYGIQASRIQVIEITRMKEAVMVKREISR